jgi:hypothetical protein
MVDTGHSDPTTITIGGIELTLGDADCEGRPWWRHEPSGDSCAWRYTSEKDHERLVGGQYGCSLKYGPATIAARIGRTCGREDGGRYEVVQDQGR